MSTSLLLKIITGWAIATDRARSLCLGECLGRATPIAVAVQAITGIGLVLLISCSSGSGSTEAPQFILAQPSSPAPLPFSLFELVSPLPGMAVFDDTAVDLVITVSDEASADVEVEWSSDLQGLLSNEQSGSAKLEPGLHTITVTVQTPSLGAAQIFRLPVVKRSDAFEALIVGTGPLSTNPPACGRVNEWTSFPQGSLVTILIPSAMPDAKKEVVLDNAQLAHSITGGQLTVEVREVSSTRIEFSTDQISIVEHSEPSEVGCVNDFACTFWSFNDNRSMNSSIIVLGPDQPKQVVGHELGHALFGLCHIAGEQIGGGSSTMSAPTERFFAQSADTLTELDSAIVASIYSSGLSPGADRAEMVAMGLIQE